MCPSSNIATRAVATLDEHPIRAFRDAGVTVTINSDDPPMFGTTLNREYEIAADLLGLDEAGVAELARAAVRASFADDGREGAHPRRDRRLRRRLSGRRKTCKAPQTHTLRGRLLCIPARPPDAGLARRVGQRDAIGPIVPIGVAVK